MEHSEGSAILQVPELKKGLKFNSFEELKFVLADYAVRHHRPFTVVHSNKNERYQVICKRGCLWRVCSCKQGSTDQWKITRIVQPHECLSAQAKQNHPQLTAKYLAWRILGIVKRDSETSVPSLMESIFAFSRYRVSYAKPGVQNKVQ
jgi:hypothetical protein